MSTSKSNTKRKRNNNRKKNRTKCRFNDENDVGCETACYCRRIFASTYIKESIIALLFFRDIERRRLWIFLVLLCVCCFFVCSFFRVSVSVSVCLCLCVSVSARARSLLGFSFLFFFFVFILCFVNKTNRVALAVLRLLPNERANPFAYVLTLLFNVSYRT